MYNSNMKIKEIIREAFSLRNDTASHDTIKTRLVDDGQVTGSNMSILILAMLVASIGLNMNSTAVIIGAMLISPLMGSIHAMAYGAATADFHLFRKSVIGLMFQVTLSILASTIYFSLSPITIETSELLARTTPSIYDVLIASCGGLAGIIGITRKEKSNVIPGVAIATALMPPLCTCGFFLARGNWLRFASAMYLFFVNAYFIFLSAMTILLILEVPQVRHVSPEAWKKLKKRVIRNTIIVIIPSLVMAGIMINSQNSSRSTSNSVGAIENVSKQVKIIYPEIENVSLGNMEQMVNNKKQTSKVFIITVKEPLSNEKKEQLNKWLNAIYNEKVTIIQRKK
jgi:uncharacterized hydrophobic protein (TIGR00271 family)